MNKRFGFFPYEAMNYKAAQAWLDRMAEQGWGLQHVYLGCIAWFRKEIKPKHFVDLDIRGAYEDSDADYLQLCSDAGWEFIQNLRGMLLFRAAPGTSPVPIQTDGELEWERFWSKYRPRIWSTLLILACVGLAALLLSLPSRTSQVVMLASNYGLLYLLYFAFTIVYAVLEGIHSRWYLARCRKSGRVENPGTLSTVLDSFYRLRAPLLLLLLFFMLIEPFGFGKTVDLNWYPMHNEYTAAVDACRKWPVLMASDLDLPDSEDSRRLTGRGSIFVDYLEYRELTHGEGPEASLHILTTERYDCFHTALAEFVLAMRQRETRNGAFLWGELDWKPAPELGFDESYTCRDNGYLLLRQGKVVVLVGCTDYDLTSPQSLEVIRERVLDRPS